MNIFEGARRIALVFGGLWAAGCIGYAAFNEPYAMLHYAVNWAKSPQIVDECAEEDATEYADVKFPDGSKPTIKLCFVAVRDSGGKVYREDSGQSFIPVALDEKEPNLLLVSERYSKRVSEYTKRYAADFKLPADAQVVLSSRKRDAYAEQFAEALKVLLGGIAIGWSLVAVIGWIVRGFLGIPKGKDSKLDTPKSEPQ